MKSFLRKLLCLLIVAFSFYAVAKSDEPFETVNRFDASENFEQKEIRELNVSVPITREMGKGETHLYSFRGEAEKCLHLAVEQLGTDVIVPLRGNRDL